MYWDWLYRQPETRATQKSGIWTIGLHLCTICTQDKKPNCIILNFVIMCLRDKDDIQARSNKGILNRFPLSYFLIKEEWIRLDLIVVIKFDERLKHAGTYKHEDNPLIEEMQYDLHILPSLVVILPLVQIPTNKSKLGRYRILGEILTSNTKVLA